MTSLRVTLADWQDVDVAEYYLALTLGLVASPEPWDGKKYIFWSNNPIGNLMFDMLCKLAVIGVLEHDEETSRFRWNSKFVLS